MVLGGPSNFLDLVIKFTNIARVHTHRGTPGFDSCEDVFWLKVNISNHGDL